MSETTKASAPSVSSSAPTPQDFEKLADSRREAQAAGERIEAIRRKAGLPPSAEPAPPPNVYWLIEYRENGQTTGYLQYGDSGYSMILTSQSSEAIRFTTEAEARRVLESEEFRDPRYSAHPERFVVEGHRNCSGPTHAEIDAARKPENASLSPVQEEATWTEVANLLGVSALGEQVTISGEAIHRVRALLSRISGSISERETLTAHRVDMEAQIDALMRDWNEALKAVARLTTERDKFRDWFQNAEQARAVAEANVERLTREKAAVEVERDTLKADVVAAAGELLVPIPQAGTVGARLLVANAVLKTQLWESQRVREQAIQDIEALPTFGLTGHVVEKAAVLHVLRRNDILREAPTNG